MVLVMDMGSVLVGFVSVSRIPLEIIVKTQCLLR
jgi:hypothetical protein